MGVMVMACKAVKKLLGYELCLIEPEGTLYYSDSIAVIRKAEYTEIFNSAENSPASAGGEL